MLQAQTEAEGQLTLLGHALATQAYFAVSSCDLTRTEALLIRAREVVNKVDDPVLAIRVALIDGCRGGLAGEDDAHDVILSNIRSAAELLADDLYTYGCSLLALIDIEQRRHDRTMELLDVSVPLSVERDVPFGRSWLLATRARIALLVGDWDDAASDADTVLNASSAPLVRTWPQLVRALISLRRDGAAVDARRHRRGLASLLQIR